MKLHLTITLLLICFISKSQTYNFSNLSLPYQELINPISINSGLVWDDLDFQVNLPFLFKINSIETSILLLNDSKITNFSNSTFIQYIIPLGVETNLIDRGINTTESLSPISYKIDGSVGNRIVKIEYKNCGSLNGLNLQTFINYQVWLYETTNIIEYRFGLSFVTNASVFYGNANGGIIGIFTGDQEPPYTISNINIISGSTSNPNFSSNALNYVTDIPANGTVFRFSPQNLNVSNFEENFFTISPNPTKEILNIDSNQDIAISSISIYNVLGQLVQVIPNAKDIKTIDVSSLKSGNYLIKIISDKGSSSSKFIKE